MIVMMKESVRPDSEEVLGVVRFAEQHAKVSAAVCSNSKATKPSSPTTQASCPGSMT